MFFQQRPFVRPRSLEGFADINSKHLATRKVVCDPSNTPSYLSVKQHVCAESPAQPVDNFPVFCNPVEISLRKPRVFIPQRAYTTTGSSDAGGIADAS